METRTYLAIAAILGLALTVCSIMLHENRYPLNGEMPCSDYVHSQIK